MKLLGRVSGPLAKFAERVMRCAEREFHHHGKIEPLGFRAF